MVKKNIGKTIALYPTPLVVVGAFVDGKADFTLVGHLGIIGHDRIMVSLAKPHHINKGIKQNNVLSVNIVDVDMLAKADYVGCVSGNNVDKSTVFDFTVGEKGSPIIDNSPVSMECSVADVYQTEGFESFILTIDGTYVKEEVLTSNGKLDYRTLKPVLFQMPTYEYLSTGEVIGKCMSFNKKA